MSFLDKLFKKSFRSSVTHQTPELKNPLTEQDGISPESHIPDQYLPLWELLKQRQLLEVKITGASRVYQSMILAIDVERGLLWLDDLFPQQHILDAGDEITLRHHRNGEQLVIRAHIVAMGSTYNASGFAITLPEFVYYMPRRSSPRYIIGHQSPLSVKIRTLGQEPSYGTLQDISTGGLRLIIAGNMLPYLRHGALLPMCEVDINDELQIRCRARICAFRIGRSPYRHTQISVEFIDMEEETRTALARFLRESQLVHGKLYAPQSTNTRAA
ncbi:MULTISPECIES: flagellar brake protein [Cellvibrio]|uniref:C-di-GMP-binding flagellar brake protein YcgR n=1 Tax=Cellvibrio fibrivorans TaxID=126350 RepID=A0ABU1UWU6_9GAMM|nr:PilZ domain-containing protein [Cellvibrio fibrivorans]MDR7089656.1 c-di-GMP-binding flagellar brake protein YcgR [Cellvibrio fibrivorans]